MGYRVRHLHRADELAEALNRGAAQTFVVIASMGVDDEEALATALRAGPPYVALVASPKRASAIRESLLAEGLSPDHLALLKAPAGLDIGARTQEEIALSILAEIVQARAAMAPAIPEEDGKTEANAGFSDALEAIDPICGMTVTIATARHSSAYGGTTWYFCCKGCKEQFDADPAAYVR
jgi:xanthine dehydrogenase accessory factor